MTEGVEPARPVRISDTDRERGAQLLQQALTEGRISIVELDERMRQVYEARFADELEVPFADLPTSPGATVTPAVRTGAALVPHPAAAPDGDVVTLSTGWGTVRRDGRWPVPAGLHVEVGSGTALLDCTEAQIPHRVVTVDVRVKSGTVKLILAPGMTADIDGVRTRSGSARSKVDAIPDPQYPHFVLSGTVGSGTLVVRRPLFS